MILDRRAAIINAMAQPSRKLVSLLVNTLLYAELGDQIETRMPKERP